jgi:hypothetical protein
MTGDLFWVGMHPPLRSTVPLTAITSLRYIPLVPELLLSMTHLFIMKSIGMAFPFVFPLKGLNDWCLTWNVENTVLRVRPSFPSSGMAWPVGASRLHWLGRLSSNSEAFIQLLHGLELTNWHYSILFS